MAECYSEARLKRCGWQAQDLPRRAGPGRVVLDALRGQPLEALYPDQEVLPGALGEAGCVPGSDESMRPRRDLLSYIAYGLVFVSCGLLFGLLYYQQVRHQSCGQASWQAPQGGRLTLLLYGPAVQATENWYNLIGLLFSVCVNALLVATLSNSVHFPMDWAMVVSAGRPPKHVERC
jgi:hypothetical protein